MRGECFFMYLCTYGNCVRTDCTANEFDESPEENNRNAFAHASALCGSRGLGCR